MPLYPSLNPFSQKSVHVEFRRLYRAMPFGQFFFAFISGAKRIPLQVLPGFEDILLEKGQKYFIPNHNLPFTLFFRCHLNLFLLTFCPKVQYITATPALLQNIFFPKSFFNFRD